MVADLSPLLTSEHAILVREKLSNRFNYGWNYCNTVSGSCESFYLITLGSWYGTSIGILLIHLPHMHTHTTSILHSSIIMQKLMLTRQLNWLQNWKIFYKIFMLLESKANTGLLWMGVCLRAPDMPHML